MRIIVTVLLASVTLATPSAGQPPGTLAMLFGLLGARAERHATGAPPARAGARTWERILGYVLFSGPVELGTLPAGRAPARDRPCVPGGRRDVAPLQYPHLSFVYPCR